jgi:hypothetical protein
MTDAVDLTDHDMRVRERHATSSPACGTHAPITGEAYELATSPVPWRLDVEMPPFDPRTDVRRQDGS